MRFVIYTAVVGSYDSVLQPTVVDDGFDYVLFSNNIECQQLGIWQVRRIPYINPDNTRIARWVKTHPEELLPDYDVSVWIDANVTILTSFIYERTLKLYSQGVLVSSMCHGSRDCIYQEAYVVAYRGAEKELVILDWLRKLRKDSYPHHNGLFETNVLYRAHYLETIHSLDEKWWNCIDQYSRRDQLSFNYCLWYLSIDCPFFISSFENTRNTEHFRYRPHQNTSHRLVGDKDVVAYFKALPKHGPEQLGVLYERLVQNRGYRLLRVFVTLFYKIRCIISQKASQ